MITGSVLTTVGIPVGSEIPSTDVPSANIIMLLVAVALGMMVVVGKASVVTSTPVVVTSLVVGIVVSGVAAVLVMSTSPHVHSPT